MLTLANARATVQSVNLRAEKHGDEEVPAVDIRLRLDRPSADLAMLGPRLRDALFWRDPSANEPDILADIDPASQALNLRCPEIAGSLPVDKSYVGCSVVLEYGLGEVALDLVKVNKLRIEPVEGGSVRLTLRVQASHIDESIAGRLAMMIDRETVVSITPPAEGEIDSDDEGDE